MAEYSQMGDCGSGLTPIPSGIHGRSALDPPLFLIPLLTSKARSLLSKARGPLRDHRSSIAQGIGLHLKKTNNYQ